MKYLLNLTADAPWKMRFRVPAILSAQLAETNPARGLVLSNLSGVVQFHTWDTRTGALEQATYQPAGCRFGSLSPDGRWVYYHQDEMGNEIGHFVRVPFESPSDPPQPLIPDFAPYASFFFSESSHGRVIGLQTVDTTGFKMYTVDRRDDDTLAPPRLLYTSPKWSVGPFLSADARHAVISTTERGQYTAMSLLAFDLSGGSDHTRVLVLEEEEGGITPVAFSPLPGDSRLLAVTDVTGFARPLIWDTATGDRTDIPLVGLDGDFQAWGWSPDATRILLRQVVQARHHLYVYDVERATLEKLNHPNGTLNNAYFATNDTLNVVFQDSITPSSVVAWDAHTGADRGVILRAYDDVPPSMQWRSFTFPSSNGQTIQGWIAKPDGEGPFPTILHAHGGPTDVQTEVYHPSAQAWVDHGFAWVTINYHGSTTFGRQFEHSILGRLGQLEVEDLASARAYLVHAGIAQPDGVLLAGASYGGYLTLLALGVRPELWAGGMAQVAIADWAVMYEDSADTLRGYQRALFGGSPQELPEQHATSSPITYARHVTAPILIIQGENDARCPARQMRLYEHTLKEQGKMVEIRWFNAGHASFNVEQNIDHQSAMLHWAYRILG